MQTETNSPSTRRSYAAKRRTKKVIALSALALFMALTIGLTWTFWQLGVGNAADPLNLTVNIGISGEISTFIDFAGRKDGGNLIPQHYSIPRTDEYDVRYVEFEINVTWLADLPQPSTTAEEEAANLALNNAPGTLRATVASFVFGNYDLLHADAFAERAPAGDFTGNADLFEIELDPEALEEVAPTPGVPIIAGCDVPVAVTITVRMNIPRQTDVRVFQSGETVNLSGQEIYNLISGSEGRLTINFTAVPNN